MKYSVGKRIIVPKLSPNPPSPNSRDLKPGMTVKEIMELIKLKIKNK